MAAALLGQFDAFGWMTMAYFDGETSRELQRVAGLVGRGVHYVDPDGSKGFALAMLGQQSSMMQVGALASAARAGERALPHSGPGLIDVPLHEVAVSPVAREELVRLTEWLETKVLALGDRVPAAILNDLSPSPGEVKFVDYPTKLLSTALTRLRQLVLEPAE